VVQTVESSNPAERATCLAGFCPRFALSTHPKNTSSTLEAGIPARLRAADKSVRLDDKEVTFHGMGAEVDCSEGGERALEPTDRGTGYCSDINWS
jgi:hypothetical protein